MSDETIHTDNVNDNEIRSQAGVDDARLEARMKSIMEQHAPRAPKARATPVPSGNPDWMKAKAKVKAQPATLPERPVRAAKRKAPAVKPPKNSEESWKLAAEYVAKKQADE